ncbi:DNA-3-methyladenine glycosylase 2 family protein [Nocardioides sp.]|jgi:3-methyladenine DNA glycosylase/8-oxoguanine DNA glycosylase|uniref:DNA-3-methyladenine glycosylase family protein n=1 Tax=Nocardioides sp. TaxID=35761 RepID=UPI002CEEBD3E|nr:DNA-3-methyladenine glycosylase 2 family protein [Nocardioides sp.]HVX54830.1 DNA-3-methyladenine glycosylase 2 family protein [Nocardioides sp.]
MTLTRTWVPPYDLSLGMLLVHRRGAGDPTYRLVDDTHHRGIRTPHGPATLSVRMRGGAVEARAWGPGAVWVLDQLPSMLGADDEPHGFDPREEVLRRAIRRVGVPRLGRTGLVMEALTPAILEQKVTGQEAFAGYRALVRRYGEQAPGPGAELDLHVQPAAPTIRSIPSWAWLRMRVDPARSRALVTAARVADSLERTVGLPGEEVERRLTSLPGIGEWTAAEVRQRAHGDPDAVSFGDYHVAKDVGWGLTGEPWDDDRLRGYLAPYRPHRGRLVTLLLRAHGHRPRHGPRLAPRTHLAL